MVLEMDIEALRNLWLRTTAVASTAMRTGRGDPSRRGVSSPIYLMLDVRPIGF